MSQLPRMLKKCDSLRVELFAHRSHEFVTARHIAPFDSRAHRLVVVVLHRLHFVIKFGIQRIVLVLAQIIARVKRRLSQPPLRLQFLDRHRQRLQLRLRLRSTHLRLRGRGEAIAVHLRVRLLRLFEALPLSPDLTQLFAVLPNRALPRPHALRHIQKHRRPAHLRVSKQQRQCKRSALYALRIGSRQMHQNHQTLHQTLPRADDHRNLVRLKFVDVADNLCCALDIAHHRRAVRVQYTLQLIRQCIAAPNYLQNASALQPQHQTLPNAQLRLRHGQIAQNGAMRQNLLTQLETSRQ